MAIRNVGSNQQDIICDMQNDVKGAQKPAPAAQEQQIASTLKTQSAPINTNIDRSRSRNTLSGRTIKADLDAKLGSAMTPARSVIGREYQGTVNNLMRSAGKLVESSNKYTSQIRTAMTHVRNDAARFISDATSAGKKLEAGQKAGAELLPQQLMKSLDSLLGELKNVLGLVKGNTNDFLGNVDSSLKSITASANGFQKAAEIVAQGNATALKKAQTANTALAGIPSQVSGLAKDYASKISGSVEPMANRAQALANDVDSFSLGGLISGAVNGVKNAVNSAVTGVKNAVGSVLGTIKNGATELAEKAFNFSYGIKEKVGNFIDEYMGPLTKALGNAIKNIFTSDKNPNGKAIDLNKLVSNTQDLRNTIAAAKNGDAAATTKLKNSYGYTTATAPKPGQMWLSANFAGGDLVDGKVTAKNFPNTSSAPAAISKTAVTSGKPDLNQMLFAPDRTLMAGSNRSITLVDANGKETKVNSMNDYKAIVATNREKAGLPANGGEPIAVQLTLEGGGGNGKRYAPAFEEMYNLGIVPASVSGTSAGAIAASFVAAGLDPLETKNIAQDPALKKFFDATITGPGVLEGRELYRYMDQKLREITGIKDRPVTFADLPIPLQLVTTKLADSQATNDMTKVQDRIFVFSKETTPNTPVAMAAVASAAIPGAFDPMEFVDVATGRTIRLADGGVLDNLPIGYQANKSLPELAIQLNEPNDNAANPNDPGSPKPLPAGNLISNNPVGNAKIGLDLLDKAATGQRDLYDRINPKPGVFVMNVPTWNLQDFKQQDSVFGFEYDNKIDPALDRQTMDVARQFLTQNFTKLTDPKASATNLQRPPANDSFNRSFTYNNETWTASHTAGSDTVQFRSASGVSHDLKVGDSRLKDWVADDASFGDLGNRLRDVLGEFKKFAGTFGL